MKFKALLITAFLLFSSTPLRVFAQIKPAIRQVVEAQLPNALPYLVEQDLASRFNTVRQGNNVRDVDAGILRAKYRITDHPEALINATASPEAASKLYLTSVQQAFGLSAALDDLELINVTSGRFGSHVTFQQSFDGVPVYGRFVKVNLNAAGLPTMIFSGYAQHLTQQTNLNTQPQYAANSAISQIETVLTQDNLKTSEPELVVYPAETPRLAWQIVAWPEQPALELEILVDASNGGIIKIQNTSTHVNHLTTNSSATSANVTGTSSLPKAIKPSLSRSRINGTGFVFDPDPLTSAGLFYGAPYTDINDTDNDEINAQRILVDLLDISQDQNGMYHLTGPHVDIVSETSGGTAVYTPPAEASPDGFQYTRANDFFEAVNVYYHIDKSQRYLQSLNVGRDIQNVSIQTNPHGLGLEDNSRYFTNQNYIAFGQGGVDDAEDAHVIWHEYGHALLQGSAPGLLNSSEGQALHEGWADFWAASYARSLAEENVVIRDDWRSLFKWDSGDGSIWQGRELSFTGKYPEDTTCDGGGFQCDIYDDGIMWASTLMEIYDVLGRSTTDRLSLASHGYLMHPVSFRDAAEAIVQADSDLNAGVNVAFLIQTFSEKGLLDINTFGPVALHNELPPTEQLGGTIPITVNTTVISSPISQVSVFYQVNGGTEELLSLSSTVEDIYTGELPLPTSSSQITYYVEAEDELGLITRLPASELESFAFSVGPDNEAPTIQHDQLPSITLIDWPAQLTATATDNLGIDVVEVTYLIDNSQGIQVMSGSFDLTLSENLYQGVFPIPIDSLESGSRISYKLTARDISASANETQLPASDYYVFSLVIEGGIFRQYDFETETQGTTASGAWQRGEPAYGLQFALSEANTWATNQSGAYPETAQLSSLELPPMNLIGIEEAYLVFWHWYDTEHSGSATPDSDNSEVIWDGGNVKASTDGGIIWNILEPNGGYNGTIASGRQNPMDGEHAFGGYSFGWRQVIAPLPVGSELRVRFDFGTDAGNDETAVYFAGWHVDDITVLIEPPSDTALPAATLLPQAIVVRDQGDTPPEPYIEVFDSTGVASVFVDYAFENDAGIPDGSFRIPMSVSRKDVFTESFPFASSTSLEVGDVLTYRFRVSDFAGNTAVFPAPEASPLKVEYRLRDDIDLLSMATPSGMWERQDSSWEITATGQHEEISSLVIGPLDLPANVDNLRMLLFYEHSFVDNHGGNIKISTDNADTWQVLLPVNGYNGALSDAITVPPGLRDQPAITGRGEGLQQDTFDLLSYKGQQIWLRSDFGAQSKLATSEFWTIRDAALAYSTLEAVNNAFDIPRDFAIHANYPDPFSNTTTVSYTLSEATPVKLEVFDVLGRRVSNLVEQDQAAGTYSLTLDGATLSNGLYLLRLETNQGSKVERIVVSK
ncbi:MAG: T9SS type A sorting domain-containing protein [Rhodothermales bacterium]